MKNHETILNTGEDAANYIKVDDAAEISLNDVEEVKQKKRRNNPSLY